MGMLINGEWHVEIVNPKTASGEFVRQQQAFREYITADPTASYPAELNRYHLYVSYACPWAHRAIIYRHLKGLDNFISMSVVHPYMGDQGWSFDQGFAGVVPDSLNHCHLLQQVYLLADPQFTGRVTVPVLWDKKTNTIVNNESADLIRCFNSAFDHLTDNHLDFYPQQHQAEIDNMNDFIYDRINNGVYKVGFATTQAAYERNFYQLFAALDELENRLAKQDYLIGSVITESDWRLFTTLIRFDAVYVSHFKCNQRCIREYPYLSRYLFRLYNYPGIQQTVNFDHIKTHYFASHASINPSGIVPLGPSQIF